MSLPDLTTGRERRVIETALDCGVPQDQLRNFLRAGIVLQKRQLRASAAARLCDREGGPTMIGYGGARGGGKSHWLLAQMGADDCQRIPGLKCLLLRKVGKASIESLEDVRSRLFGKIPHDFAATRGSLTFRNGSRILAGHFQGERDIDSYLGLEYDVIGVEEATTLTSAKFEAIETCCRTSKNNWRPRIYCTTNPGGVGHAWFKRKFIDPFQGGAETETRFIPARVTDNPFVNKEYSRNLAKLTGWQRKAWFEGSWDIAAGQYFTPFRSDVHVGDWELKPDEAQRWRVGFDYGFAHYTVALLGAEISDGRLLIVDEYAARRTHPRDNARGIAQMLQRNGLAAHQVLAFVAGSDVVQQRLDGRSVWDEYARLGIRLSPANMDRVYGWTEILRRLGDPERGIPPTLFIHKRCTMLIDALTRLQHDPARPEDVLKEDCDDEGIGGDDAGDALRYLVATRVGEMRFRSMRR